MRRIGVSDIAAYHVLLENKPSVFNEMVDDLVIGETYFFREPAHFEHVRNVVIPETMCIRERDHSFRCWSAGCASGEEPYSLAILLDQVGLGKRSKVFATDVSPRALAKARAASYGEWSVNRNKSADHKRYFVRTVGHYQLLASIQARVSFDCHNLALPFLPDPAIGLPAMDLIFCRNVMIYFNPEAIRSLAQRMYHALAPGGWLMTGSSDPPLNDQAPFETVILPSGIFYRRPMRDTAAVGRRLFAVAPPPDDSKEWTTATADVPLRPQPRLPATVLPLPSSAQSSLPIVARKKEKEPSRPSPKQSPLAGLAEARRAFQAGAFSQVVSLGDRLAATQEGSVLWVRALANIAGSAAAETAVRRCLAKHQFSSELQYLNAILLIGMERYDEARTAARQAVYLDSDLVVAHFVLGALLLRDNDLPGAHRAYRNALRLCKKHPHSESVTLADGATSKQLARSAMERLAHIAALQGAVKGF